MRKPIVLVFTIISFFYACTKIQSTDIGSGLIPPVDGVTTKDTTVELIVNTAEDENFGRVYKADDHVIGVLNNDPVFGKTLASAYFELKPAFYPFYFPGAKDSLKVDSAVLVLSYKGVYGDSSSASPSQTWNVYEINASTPLKHDSSYAAQTANIQTGSLLATKKIDVAILGKDSLKDRFESSANQIRIKLDLNNNAFATRFIKTYDSLSGNAYSNDSIFRLKFPGFAIVPAAGAGNALIRINLLDTNTKLSLYYSGAATGAAVRDTAVRNFVFAYSSSSTSGTSTLPLISGSANSVKRDRTSNPQINTYLSKLDSNRNDSLVFIQTSPGTFVRIKVPNLRLFPNTIIHRADLIMEQVPADPLLDAYMAPPRYLLLSAYDSVNKRRINIHNDFIIDPNSGPNISAFGGFAIYKDVPGYGRIASYDFNLTRYIQGVVTRRDTAFDFRLSAPSNDSISYIAPYPTITSYTTFYIPPTSANIIANGRVRLAGGRSANNTPLRMRLRIIYSLL